jgi:hypothetical protein
MTDTLRVKRRLTGSPGAPGSLANAELAYNEVDHILYYGEGTGGAGGTASTVAPIAGQGLASTTLPLIDGTAAIGTAHTWARADHVHPSAGGGASITISDTAPASPAAGNMWWDSVGGLLYLYYQDPNTSQWVNANAAQGIPEAPNDGKLYGRQSKAWASALATSAIADIGRNKLHNGLFNIQQRGTGPFTAAGYTADRWTNGFVTTGGSCAIAITAITATNADSLLGDEDARFNLSYANTAGSGAGDYSIISQPIEDVRRLAGKTVTVSFWAWAASGTPKIGLELSQNFGAGGSPSAPVYGIGSQAITISTTPTRYTATVTLPTTAGATYGTTAGTSYTYLSIWLSSGATNAARASNIGFQSNTFNFWGMQLEIGSQATPLEKLDPRIDLANCQRFYQGQSGYSIFSGYASSSISNYISVPFVTTLRAVPTVTTFDSANSGFPAGVPNVQSITTGGFVAYKTANATGEGYFQFTYTASADL